MLLKYKEKLFSSHYALVSSIMCISGIILSRNKPTPYVSGCKQYGGTDVINLRNTVPAATETTMAHFICAYCIAAYCVAPIVQKHVKETDLTQFSKSHKCDWGGLPPAHCTYHHDAILFLLATFISRDTYIRGMEDLYAPHTWPLVPSIANYLQVPL